MRNLFLLMTLLCIVNAYSQIEAVTKKGDTIIVYDNGTWKKKTEIKTTEIESTVKATVKVDDFSGEKTITTENWTFGLSNTKRQLSGNIILLNSGIYVINISLVTDLGCMSEQRSTFKVKLSNDEIIEFIQISKTDCGDYIDASFIPINREQMKLDNYKDIINENINKLKEYAWVSIRINGSEYYTDIKPKSSKKIPNPEQFFRQHLIAISNKL